MSATTKSKKPWRVISPVPPGAPEATFTHYVRGRPLRIFTYTDSQGQLLGHTCRFATSSGGHIILPLTYCRSPDGESYAWRWQQFEGMRPLFGLERLAQVLAEDPQPTILLVYDEMSATYAQSLRLAQVVLSWPGGPRKISQVDFSALQGHRVTIWADHGAQPFRVAKGDPQTGQVMPRDRQPMWRAALQLTATLKNFHCAVMPVVSPHEDETFPDGWNVARAVEDKWSAEIIERWMYDHLQFDSMRPRPVRIDHPEPAFDAPAQPGQGADGSAMAGASTPTQASAGEDSTWQQQLLRSEGTGPLLPELLNVRLVLSKHERWRGVIFLDEFAQRVMKAAPPPFEGGVVGEWSDTDDSQAHEWLSSQAGMLKLRTSMVAQAVQTVAKLNGKNPLVERLNGLRWDKTPRLNTWLAQYLGAGAVKPDMTQADIERLHQYLALVGRLWLMGAVARAYRPGCKFDYVLVLEGQQGLGKSSALSIIGGEWAMDTPFSLSDKEGMENIRGKWIVELSELDSFNRAESTTAKSFFSRVTDRFRLPYGKRSADFKRTCVFAGTTNEHEYFRDSTGNRRYWPVACGRQGFNAEALKRDLDQLLAEAVHLYKAGEQFWPTPRQEDELVIPEQEIRAVPDTWVSRIAWWLEHSEYWALNNAHERITTRLLLEKAVQVEAGRQDQVNMAMRIGKAMTRLGYEKKDGGSKLADRFYYVKRQSSDQGDDE